MSTNARAGSWVALARRNPLADLRLYCFPYGGAGASIFRAWAQSMPEAVEVCAVQLPGRENRLHEAPFTQVNRLVPELGQVLTPHLTHPFALFGHSLGAFIAFELARQLRAQNAQGPVHLFVSGQRAPQLPDSLPPIYHLPDSEFLAEIHRRYDAIPRAVLSSPLLMQVLLPLLRADFTMNDTYAYADDTPLDCPITCFGGQEDPETTNEQLSAWRQQTNGAFTLTMFPGGHFFLDNARTLLLQVIHDNLISSINDNR